MSLDASLQRGRSKIFKAQTVDYVKDVTMVFHVEVVEGRSQVYMVADRQANRRITGAVDDSRLKPASDAGVVT